MLHGHFHLLSLLQRLVDQYAKYVEKLANNKRSNIARHLQNQHAAFAQKDLHLDEKKTEAVLKLKQKVEQINSKI